MCVQDVVVQPCAVATVGKCRSMHRAAHILDLKTGAKSYGASETGSVARYE